MSLPLRPLAAGFLVPALAAAQAPAPLPPPPLLSLPGLQDLLAEARAHHPGQHRAQALLEAERTKPGPSGALPDPEVALGVTRAPAMDVTITAEPGMPPPMLMGVLPERTEYSVMASQALPWPGKRAAREDVARAGLKRAEAEAEGMALQVEGEVLEAVLDLLALRAQRQLLTEQDQQWAAAEDLAKTCCELGRGSAADLLQAMQERARLRQKQLALAAREADLADTLARSLGRSPGEAPELPGRLLDLPLPGAPGAEALQADLLARSPLWKVAQVDQAAAEQALRLAGLERRPDLRLTAGLMKESGMPLGWKAEVGFSVPIFTARKQSQVVAQRRAEQAGTEAARLALQRLVAQRSRERARAWDLAHQTARLVDQELLPQGRATVEAQLSRYESGKAEFPVVLESLRSLLRDRESHLAAVVQLHRLALQQRRADLASPPPLELSLAGASMGSSAGSVPASAPSAAAGPAPASAPSPAPMKM